MNKFLNFRYLLAALLVAASIQSYSQATDDQVKTVFVFNFTRYIQWPTNESNFTIGILGDDTALEKAFQDMASKKSTSGKKIIIKSFASASETNNCNILYIPKDQSSQFSRVKSQDLKNVLIITEKAGLGRQGSGINFIEVNGKMRFEINKGEIERAGLKVSSQLLGLANEV
ncbi:YfiR family protein [Fulvivirga sp. 29W222]|uniref:YfiR family protein n=1 Tax=Fulvivirga marina TaxID=2494733 RepID=A0A937FV72_9BACT|nr:YfiR family protein [Fulvivirga marina]MBL6445058.1 YfiR family protein [Fulvivirga marina]